MRCMRSAPLGVMGPKFDAEIGAHGTLLVPRPFGPSRVVRRSGIGSEQHQGSRCPSPDGRDSPAKRQRTVGMSFLVL